MVLDDLATGEGAAWRLVTDRVMGGVSDGSLALDVVAGRRCLRLLGSVRLENDGGFVQMARDFVPGGGPFDGRRFDAVEVDVFGTGEVYGVHLKTADTVRPWQSYRHGFTATAEWRRVVLPFAGFRPHRVAAPLDLGTLRRIGLVAIGRAFSADLAVARVALVPSDPF